MPSARIPGVKNEEYTINLHPDVETLGSAYIDIIEQYGWDAITILYENNDSMMRLKAIFDKTSKVSDNEQFSILTRELVNNDNGYRDVSRIKFKNDNNEGCICVTSPFTGTPRCVQQQSNYNCT